MRHLLLATTCCFALASAASAQTSVATKTITPIRTSTIKNGAADSIVITSAGSVELTAPGAAVTVDSANKVTNQGLIQVSNADNATGILAQAGTSGGILNSLKIVVDETYTATDGDNDGDIDGPFAVGTGRVGIATAGAYTGDIVSDLAGTITVEGNDSFGIRLGGPLSGNFSHDSVTSVLGDRAIGIQTGAVSGNVRIAGTVNAQGVGAAGVKITDNIAGTLTIQGGVNATGYRYTTAPTDTSKLDADDLLQGGPAVLVQGDVLGGIILAIPPTTSTTDTDVDKDGLLDATEGTAAVRSYGAAPAMRIGSATRDITIGAVPATGTGYGLIVNGSIAGAGVYAGVTGTGLDLGGLGGKVTIAGGIGVTGSITATSPTVSATAIHFGSGATTPLLHVTGTVSASGSSLTNTVAGGVVIDAGATLPYIKNAGTIKSTTTGVDGTAIAIIDRSNTLNLIENSGTISATGATAGSGRNIAIDLSTNATGTIVRQTVVASTATAPSITGSILFGGGNDLFDIADGTVTGDTYFGAGADTLTLSGDAVYTGNAYFGTGTSTMSLAGTSQFVGAADFGGGVSTLGIGTGSTFTGTLVNSGNLAVAISGGKLDLGAATAQISSLAVTNSGILAVTLNNAGNTVPLIGVSGTASFATGSKLLVKVTDVTNAVGNHLILSAGTLTGAGNLTADSTLVPFLYKATLSSSGNNLNVALARKANTELGLNRSESAAFDAVYAALAKNKDVAGTFLTITDATTFGTTMQQMLPDHAGGTFQAVTQGMRTFARMLEDPTGPFKDEGKWGYWINQITWGVDKGRGDTAAYETSGWGFGGGAELKTDFGSFGGSIAYYWGRNRGTETDNQVTANSYELAGYWRLKKGPLRVTTRGSIAFVNLDGTRNFAGLNGTTIVSQAAGADRSGRVYSGVGTLSYDVISGGISFRPVVSVDYYRLHEKGYAETGASDAFNLIVRSRTSDEFAVTGSGVIGFNAGGQDQWSGWSRFEVELGRREIVGGAMGSTVAHFSGGNDFTLLPDDRDSGWIGRLRGVAGNSGFQVGGELGADQYQGNWALSLRASLRVGL